MDRPTRIVTTMADQTHSQTRKQALQARNSANSQLLKLPAELRNRIWSYSLSCSPDLLKIETTRTTPNRKLTLCCGPPVILKVCHQIRREAGSIYYAEYVFDVWSMSDVGDHYENDFYECRWWLAAVGPTNRSQLCHLYPKHSECLLHYPNQGAPHIKHLYRRLVEEDLEVPKHAIHFAVASFCCYPHRNSGESTCSQKHWLHLEEGTDEPNMFDADLKAVKSARAGSDHVCCHG
jgi:hypothetical protein